MQNLFSKSFIWLHNVESSNWAVLLDMPKLYFLKVLSVKAFGIDTQPIIFSSLGLNSEQQTPKIMFTQMYMLSSW